MHKVQAQLAHVRRNHFDLQLTAFDVARHQRRKVGRYDVRDVVEHFLVAGGGNCGRERDTFRTLLANVTSGNCGDGFLGNVGLISLKLRT